MSPETRILFPEDVRPGDIELGDGGELRLVQEVDVPEGALAVRMQVGDLPVTIIGWIAGAEALPDLLRNVAAETEGIMRDSAEAAGDNAG